MAGESNKEGKSGRNKHRSNKDKRGGKKKSDAQMQGGRAAPAKLFKLSIRKLPPRNFGKEELAEAFARVYACLGVDVSNVVEEQFLPGKVSRKKGPQTGAVFVCFNNNDAVKKILAQVPSVVPFLPAELALTYDEPQLDMALYHRGYRSQDSPKPDRMEGTYKQDAEWAAFQAACEAAPRKRMSAETVFEEKAASELRDKEEKTEG